MGMDENISLDLRELCDTVREMRNAQRRYFRTRNDVDLRMAKHYERKVDALIAEHDSQALFRDSQ
jgi:hypothetical protein